MRTVQIALGFLAGLFIAEGSDISLIGAGWLLGLIASEFIQDYTDRRMERVHGLVPTYRRVDK